MAACCATAVRLVFAHHPGDRKPHIEPHPLKDGVSLLWLIAGGHQRITQMLLEAGAESGLQSVAEGEEGEEEMGHDRVQNSWDGTSPSQAVRVCLNAKPTS
eukprot:4601183-Prymnesium_polylepis.2